MHSGEGSEGGRGEVGAGSNCRTKALVSGESSTQRAWQWRKGRGGHRRRGEGGLNASKRASQHPPTNRASRVVVGVVKS